MLKKKMFSPESPAHSGQVDILNPVPHQLAAGWCGTPKPLRGRLVTAKRRAEAGKEKYYVEEND